MVDDQLSYNQHRQKAIKKTVQKLGMVKRTFANRTIPFLKVIWNSILQPHQDYGSILTAPYQKCERKASEHPLRVLTKLPSECKKCHYWDRLQKFRLYSNERRCERYKIFYIWKSLNGLVPSIGFKFQQRDKSKLIYPKVIGGQGRSRTLQRYSLKWEGVRLYNSLPEALRKWTGSKEVFKNKLDIFLQLIPDQPEVDERKPGGRTLDGVPSNSIPDWVRTLNLDNQKPEIDDSPMIELDGQRSNEKTISTDFGVVTNFITCNSNFMGSGHSPDHS